MPPTLAVGEKLLEYLQTNHPTETVEASRSLGLTLQELTSPAKLGGLGVPASSRSMRLAHQEERRLAKIIRLSVDVIPQIPSTP